MRWLQDRIPPVSATELGVFRALFGLGLAWIIDDMRLPAQPFPPELHLRVHSLAEWPWVHRLAAQPERVAALEWSIIVLAVVFAAGLFTRGAFAVCVAAITVWSLVRLTHTGAHNWSALFVTLWALLPVRWGDGFSLDALIRRARGLPAFTQERRADYGYALWMPGLVFSAAMAGAGVAKLAQSGLAWVTNGSVKYHFLIDAANAPTDWGLWVASHPRVAVLLSALAIATECTLVLAVFVPDWRARLPFALMAGGLLGGFYVFQNEVWPAWWLLCLAFFVPWPALVRLVSGTPERAAAFAEPAGPSGLSTPSVAASRPAVAGLSGPHRAPVVTSLTSAQVAAIAIVCALQVVASVARVEWSPVMSDYPMYATTYASPEEFERRNTVPPTYHFSVRFDDGVEQHASDLFERLELDGPVRDAYLAIVEQREHTSAAAAIAAAERQLAAHFGRRVTAIIVAIDQRGFDWDNGRFYWKAIRKPVYTFETR